MRYRDIVEADCVQRCCRARSAAINHHSKKKKHCQRYCGHSSDSSLCLSLRPLDIVVLASSWHQSNFVVHSSLFSSGIPTARDHQSTRARLCRSLFKIHTQAIAHTQESTQAMKQASKQASMQRYLFNSLHITPFTFF